MLTLKHIYIHRKLTGSPNQDQVIKYPKCPTSHGAFCNQTKESDKAANIQRHGRPHKIQSLDK